jgi:hypoxanthine phosphoribosyltransferase
MISHNERLETDILLLKDRILYDPIGILDPDGLMHHEFANGEHGRKLDLDKIILPRDNDIYINLVSVYARAIHARYKDNMPDALVGVANGANRLAVSMAPLLGKQILGLTTEKINEKTVKLSPQAFDLIADRQIKFALIIEDVGTTGGTIVSAAEDLIEFGVQRIEAMTAWQRKPILSRLVEAGITHSSVIVEPLSTYSPTQCLILPEGYCARNVPLISHAA